MEVNPFMSLALDEGVSSFFIVKAAITSLGVVILAGIKKTHLAIVGLYGIAAGYAILLAYHAWLIWMLADPTGA